MIKYLESTQNVLTSIYFPIAFVKRKYFEENKFWWMYYCIGWSWTWWCKDNAFSLKILYSGETKHGLTEWYQTLLVLRNDKFECLCKQKGLHALKLPILSKLKWTSWEMIWMNYKERFGIDTIKILYNYLFV